MSAASAGARGFVLAATLWTLAALALLGAWIADAVGTDVRSAIGEKESFRAELDRRNTEATLVYLLATGRMNHRALILEEEQRFANAGSGGPPGRGHGELRVTGAVYAGPGGIRFSVQDEGGLVPVNAPRAPPFAALLERAAGGAAGVDEALARIEDHIDVEYTRGANDGERGEGRFAADEPPLGGSMASPMELGRVPGIDALISPAERQRLWPLLTARPVYGYNFNTMRPEILTLLLGLDDRGLRQLLEERERGPVSRLSQVAMLSGRHLDIDEMDVSALPSSFFRLSLWHESGGPRIVVGVELTPLGESAPWRKGYRYSRPVDAREGFRNPRVPVLESPIALLR